MDEKIWIKVFEKTSREADAQLLFKTEVEQSFRVGRQELDEAEPVGFVQAVVPQSKLSQKLVIAPATEREYSRTFAEVELNNGQIKVTNSSSNQLIFLSAEAPLQPHESRTLSVPFKITLVDRTILFYHPVVRGPTPDVKSLPASMAPSVMATYVMPSVSLMRVSRDGSIDGERLVDLLQTVMQFFQESPSSQEFFDNAAQAISQLLELDHILIAFLDEHRPSVTNQRDDDQPRHWADWVAQSYLSKSGKDSEWAPSRQILSLVQEDKQTVYHIPDVRSESLVGINSLVASPLKNAKDEVIGVIYGDRGVTVNNQEGFLQTEAMFVELFANGISVGLERIRQERKMSEMRARFDQFFTPSLARQLEADASMLEPRSAQVSIVFADIRGFSRISERIGPNKTIHWINSVMTHLSDCVLRNDGVVVDYVGDEIMAMWGAPIDQENHAELAVQAAREMLQRLPAINKQWAELIGEPVDFGIGINSGEAQVGNTGSEKKFKYGPLGDVVNISSRLQGTNKQVGTQILITESCADMLPQNFPRRRIRSVRFVNVERAVTIYEVPLQPDDHWLALRDEYEAGLKFFEQNQLPLASQKMASIIAQWKDDKPAMILLSDAVKFMQMDPEKFDSVWQLVQK